MTQKKKMNPKTKKRLQLFIKISVSSVLLVVLLQYIDFSAAIKAISTVNIPLFILAAFAVLGSVFVNSFTWHFLLPEKKVGLLMKLVFIARFYSTILPGQVLGEASKVIFMKKHDSNLHRITASIIVDKSLGFIALFIIGITGLLVENVGNLTLNIVLSAIVAALVVCLLLLRNDAVYHFFFNLIGKISLKIKFISKLQELIRQLREYSQNLKAMVYNLIFSVIFQLLGVLQYFILCQALDINISFMALAWIFAIISVALFIPISIAGLGVRELTLVGLLGYYGVQGDDALALSMLIFILTIFVSIIGGILSFHTVVAGKQKKSNTNINRSLQ